MTARDHKEGAPGGAETSPGRDLGAAMEQSLAGTGHGSVRGTAWGQPDSALIPVNSRLRGIRSGFAP